VSVWYDGHIILIQATFVSLLLALSIQVPLRMGVFSFAGVGAYGIGAYTSAIMTIRYEWSAPLAILAGIVLSAAISFVLALLLARLGGLYLGMATIAFDLIFTVIVTNGGDLTGGAEGLFGAISDINIPEIIAVTVLIIIGIAYTERGSLGRRIDAVRTDPELAASMGIKVARYRRAALVFSGALGACAGGINVLLRTTVAPTDIGFSLVVLALTMIIVGGAGSWLGAAIGAIIFTWLPNVLLVVGQWQAVIYGVIVALAAVWVPGGLLGVTKDLRRSSGARKRAEAVRVASLATDAGVDSSSSALGQLAAHGESVR
jgi:branched-chain amino acid transport system permease protein